jgi:hypothetical protein
MAPDPRASRFDKFSPAEMPPVRPYLPPTWARYIEGEYYGLQNLATQLYDFAMKGNLLVDLLQGKVNELLGRQGSARWSGESAQAFKASYGQDAAILSAHNKIVAAAAGIIDHLAERLASIEATIEQQVSYGLEQGYFLRGTDWAKTSTPSPNPAFPGAGHAMDEFARLLRQSQKQSTEARNLAAHELTKINEIIMEILRYYQARGGRINDLDPGGLLRQGQIIWYTPRINELQKQLNSEKKQLESSEISAKTVGADMQKIGGGAETIGGLMGLIKPLEPAGEAVSTVGGVVSQLGEATEHFGG